MFVKATLASLLGWSTQRGKNNNSGVLSKRFWAMVAVGIRDMLLCQVVWMAGVVPHHEISFVLNSVLRQISELLWFCWSSFRYHCSGHRQHAARASCCWEWVATGDIGGSSEATKWKGKCWMIWMLEWFCFILICFRSFWSESWFQQWLQLTNVPLRAFGHGGMSVLTLAKLDQARPLGFLNFVCTNPPTIENNSLILWRRVQFVGGQRMLLMLRMLLVITQLRQGKRLDSVGEFMNFVRCSSEWFLRAHEWY